MMVTINSRLGKDKIDNRRAEFDEIKKITGPPTGGA
jgi:hypothetical protein